MKAEITKVMQAQIDEANGKAQTLEQQLYTEMIGGRFTGSKFIADKMAIPADFVQARFGDAFKIEDGKVVAYNPDGSKVYSRTKPGELAGFDEALESLVEQYPQKDHILKASGKEGSGMTNQYQAGQKTMKRSQFDSLSPVEQRSALTEKVTIID